MSSIVKKVKEALEDVKDKTVGDPQHTKENVGDYAKQTADDSKEYQSKEPMSPAKISEHEPTAVKRENTSSTGSSSQEEAKEKLRRSGMTEGTAGST